jgi:hypothetical protein
MKYTLTFLADKYFIIEGELFSEDSRVVCESPSIINEQMSEHFEKLFNKILNCLNEC